MQKAEQHSEGRREKDDGEARTFIVFNSSILIPTMEREKSSSEDRIEEKSWKIEDLQFKMQICFLSFYLLFPFHWLLALALEDGEAQDAVKKVKSWKTSRGNESFS